MKGTGCADRYVFCNGARMQVHLSTPCLCRRLSTPMWGSHEFTCKAMQIWLGNFLVTVGKGQRMRTVGGKSEPTLWLWQ